MPRTQSFIFLSVNKPLRLLRWPTSFVEIELPADPLHNSQLVVTIQNLELLGQAGFLPMRLE